MAMSSPTADTKIIRYSNTDSLTREYTSVFQKIPPNARHRILEALKRPELPKYREDTNTDNKDIDNRKDGPPETSKVYYLSLKRASLTLFLNRSKYKEFRSQQQNDIQI